MDIPSVGRTLPPGSPPPDKNVMPSGTTTSMSNAVQSPAPADTTSAETKKATDDINKTLQDRGQDVRFSIDESSKRVVVKIIDQNTDKVLRQIPTEQALEISQSLDKLQGLLIKQEA